MWLLMACAAPHDSAPTARPDMDSTCTGPETVTLVSEYDGDGYTFSWTVAAAFTDAGGSFASVDASWLTATCPPCGEAGDRMFAVRVTVSSSDGETLNYLSIDQTCPG